MSVAATISEAGHSPTLSISWPHVSGLVEIATAFMKWRSSKNLTCQGPGVAAASNAASLSTSSCFIRPFYNGDLGDRQFLAHQAREEAFVGAAEFVEGDCPAGAGDRAA